MAVQLIFYFFYVILDNFKLKKQYVKLNLVLTVLINLTQLIKTMHDIYKIWGSNSESKKKKISFYKWLNGKQWARTIRRPVPIMSLNWGKETNCSSYCSNQCLLCYVIYVSQFSQLVEWGHICSPLWGACYSIFNNHIYKG